MRVKRLEIQGFKSFKDKTVIHFDHGITGIVGPNGCGKSNIVDAFFWVMGEQSYKHMRGSGSDDLIFNGSSKHSPLGIAEATLVMETDVVDTQNAPAGASAQDLPLPLKSKEISVTRRLYRDGEGEYFINGTSARLRDIQELFMDTGVGAKGYSVIEQGQIGKIVNAKPEDRRLLVEEAAGIAKYKARKKESIRKMEATQANLSRLNDVIQEIERNLNSLERQAQKARQYKKYKDELFGKEIDWGRRKARAFGQKLVGLKKHKEALEQELLGLRAELQVAENSIETDRVDQLTDTKQAEELQAKIQNLSDELTRQRSALDLSKRRQDDLSSQLTSLSSEKTELLSSLENERSRLSAQEAQVREADQAFSEASQAAQAMSEKVSTISRKLDELRRETDMARRQLLASVATASELTSRSAALASRADSSRSQIARLGQQAQAHIERLNQAKIEADQAREASESVKSKKELLQAEKREQASQVQSQEQKLRQEERELDEASKALTQTKSRLQSLEELASSHEGFGDAPKAALDWAKSQGARGLSALADLMEVLPEGEVAAAAYLESRLQNLFSDDASLALQALEQIREGKQGRAAIHVFKPKLKLADLPKAERLLSSAGFKVTGCLSEYVKTSHEIAADLVESVLVVESFAPMASFIRAGKAPELEGAAVVSLSGEVLDASGTLRGGSLDNSGATGVLKRKRTISELKAQLTQATELFENRETAAAQSKKSLELARARLQTVTAELQTLEIESAALERDVVQSARTLRDLESQAEFQSLEIAEMEQDLSSSETERQEVAAKLAATIAARAELESRIAESEALISEQDVDFRNQDSEFQLLRIREASSRERSSSLRRELDAGRALVADREKRMAEIDRILTRASQEQASFSGGESGLELRISELTVTLGHAREALSAVKDRIEESRGKLDSSLERIKELHRTGDEKTTETNGLALEIEKLSGEISHLTLNLEEKYGPGCLDIPVASAIQEEMTEPVVTAEMTAQEEQELGEEVERLRERIRRLGEVNVMAIEEYEEAKKRYDYLLTEKGDLEHSIENLQEAIEHINKTSEDRFRKAFEAIAERFEKLFPIIFGGGSAKLSLVYPEGSNDILEAGIDILAQPPGKKVSNITLLSGGEKALTAVSLIFAIFMVKPSPFCVLDEVDAPLDDANIGKFNALLREMAAKSQFIVITHNKKTMELNDTLYGVTMEEPGVSKMVSIELQ